MSRVAVGAMGELYTALQKGMDQELEATAKALLQKAGESNAFIRQDVDAALDSMVQHCTPTRSLNALLTSGLRSDRHSLSPTSTLSSSAAVLEIYALLEDI